MTFDEAGGQSGHTVEPYPRLNTAHPAKEGTCRLVTQAAPTGVNLSTAGSTFTPPGQMSRLRGEFEVAKRHPLKALKVFVMILFDVIAEIRHERKCRKEFKR
jgi:hypothetical protein